MTQGDQTTEQKMKSLAGGSGNPWVNPFREAFGVSGAAAIGPSIYMGNKYRRVVGNSTPLERPGLLTGSVKEEPCRRAGDNL